MKTDSQLQHDVSAEFLWEPSVHATDIGVEVKNGVVTLTGQFDSHAEKWRAVRHRRKVGPADLGQLQGHQGPAATGSGHYEDDLGGGAARQGKQIRVKG